MTTLCGALDANGLPYLISMRSFYIINRRASTTNGASTNGAAPNQSARRERLRFRDMVSAFHSESQELLLNASTVACDGKMTWSDAKALGISLWVNSSENLVSLTHSIKRCKVLILYILENATRSYCTKRLYGGR